MEVLIVLVIILALIFMLCVVKINYFENKVKNEKRITKKTGLMSLGELPYNDQNGSLLIENKPKANITKYIKDIRDILAQSNQKVISIISSKDGEGKSYVSNNLAVSLARLNKNVLLIDANLRKESDKSDIFYIEKGEGLTDYIKEIEIGNNLENLNNAKKYIKQTQIPHLYILQNGTITENCYELLKTQNVKELIALLKDVYDIILIDGTAFFENEDALYISKLSDTNILIAENCVTTYKEILEVKDQLEYYNAKVFGFILNKTDFRKGKYYSKKNNSKYGMFIENIEEQDKVESFDEIIDPITKKLYSKEPLKFETLHQEIKDNIMTEDFINDVEVNFNMKIDNIQKQNEISINGLLDSIQTLRKDITEEKENNDIRREKQSKSFDRFTQIITDKFEKIEEQIVQIKKKDEIEKEYFEERIDEQKKAFNNHIQEQKNHFNEKLIENTEILNERIENQNLLLNKKIEQQENQINTQSNVFDKKMEQQKNQQNEQLQIQQQVLKEFIENQTQFLNDIMATQVQIYNERLDNIETQVSQLSEKQKAETEIIKDDNKIINLGKFFNNRRKNNTIFSIHEPISYEELERLAIEVIPLNDDTNYYNDLAK